MRTDCSVDWEVVISLPSWVELQGVKKKEETEQRLKSRDENWEMSEIITIKFLSEGNKYQYFLQKRHPSWKDEKTEHAGNKKHLWYD